MLDFSGVWADVMKRKYITVGFTGFVLMIPLAITSTAGWIRRLGGKRWQILPPLDLSERYRLGHSRYFIGWRQTSTYPLNMQELVKALPVGGSTSGIQPVVRRRPAWLGRESPTAGKNNPYGTALLSAGRLQN